VSARKLHVSPALALPQDVVTSTLIVYGGKGMGKTNFGSVLVEELAAAGLRFSVLDPMGVWWGLRHSADGKGPGIEVLILGGIHGDIPIEPTGGAVVADLVVDEDANVVLDISRRPDGTMWAIAERVRFVRDYGKRLYQRQGEQRRPLLQVLDEAARFIPQIIRKDDSDVAACMGAIAVLVEEGRNVGVGVALITQRSARLNKDVAELADCMIAFRTLGPNSRRAVLDWLGEHVEKDRVKEFDQQVRALPRGSALVVSPGWLEYEGVVPMRARQTFDSSATPKRGEDRRASGPGAKPDLAKYQQRMAATIEKAKAEDPRELRRRIAELERQVAGRLKAAPARVETKVETQRVEIPVLKDGQVQRLERAATKLADAGVAVTTIGRELVEALKKFHANGKLTPPVVHTSAVPRDAPPVRPLPPARRPAPPVDGDFRPSRPQQRILDALAWLEMVGVPQAKKTQLALLAEQSPTSSGYTNNLGELRTAGVLEYPAPTLVRLTEAGRAIASIPERPHTTEALHQALYARLSRSEAAILRALIAAYPDDRDRGELATAAEQSPTSSGYTNNLGALRSLGLIDYPTPGRVVALPVLFLEGAAR
jgi:hypothetical protein